ncbi:MAG: hypothetical protein H7A50_00545 [Akkermansiaceae bacterium]|nr:hypothetical protein [Akkermansiaceae bacterium]
MRRIEVAAEFLACVMSCWRCASVVTLAATFDGIFPRMQMLRRKTGLPLSRISGWPRADGAETNGPDELNRCDGRHLIELPSWRPQSAFGNRKTDLGGAARHSFPPLRDAEVGNLHGHLLAGLSETDVGDDDAGFLDLRDRVAGDRGPAWTSVTSRVMPP